jgi:hypothetical protein
VSGLMPGMQKIRMYGAVSSGLHHDAKFSSNAISGGAGFSGGGLC